MLMSVRGLSSGYQRNDVLHQVDLDIAEGEIVSLIGANGAGKSTLLMTLCGIVKPRTGQILFDQQPIHGQTPDYIMKHGLAISAEGRRIFPRMTVWENLQLGATKLTATDLKHDLEYIFQTFPVLAKRLNQAGGTLSGGEQQMLAIARALLMRPRLLLLDEPSLGLAPLIVRQIFQMIKELNQNKGMTILLVEQNAKQALKLAHRGYVLVNGRITTTGTGQELLARPDIQHAYLGM